VIFNNQDLKKQILFASPDLNLLSLLSFLLVADGFRVVAENEVSKAIESIERRRPDLVLLDLSALAKENRSTFILIQKMQSHPPIVFLVEPQYLCLSGQITSNGIHDFVAKPIDYQEIRKHLHWMATPAAA
jgi:DNA-binding response OmpR family regulator